jgi:uncharacterized protein (DUF736 family)
MAQYEARPNTGVLFNNETKKAENHPDLRGSVDIDRNLLIDLLKKHQTGAIKIAIAAWRKESQNGNKFLSLSASEPYEKPAGAAPAKNPWE